MIAKRLPLILIVIICLICPLFVSLNAEWMYPDMSLTLEKDSNINVDLIEFEYTPEEILPGGDNNEQVQVGQNHLLLIKNVVDHVTYGLNATDKPIVRELLEDGATAVYSNQNVSGGNLKHMLINDSSMEALDFAVKYENATFYSTFTFESKWINSNSNIGKEIEVYKTDMINENGTWVAKRSYKGTAKVARVTAKNKQIVNIDVFSWVQTHSTTTTSNSN